MLPIWLAALKWEEGLQLEAFIYTFMAFFVFIVTRQQISSPRKTLGALWRDLKNEGGFVKIILIVVVIQLVGILTASFYSSNRPSNWLLAIFVQNIQAISLSIIAIGFVSIILHRILFQRKNRSALLFSLSSDMLTSSIVFIFLPSSFFALSSVVLYVLGIVLFTGVILIVWITGDQDRLRHLTVLQVTTLLVSSVFIYGIGFNDVKDGAYLDTMIDEAVKAVGLEIAIAGIPKNVTGEMFVQPITFIKGPDGKIGCVDFQELDALRQETELFRSSLAKYLPELIDHANKSAEAASILKSRTRVPTSWFAEIYGGVMKTLMILETSLDRQLKMYILEIDSITDRNASKTLLEQSLIFNDSLADTEEIAKETGPLRDATHGFMTLLHDNAGHWISYSSFLNSLHVYNQLEASQVNQSRYLLTLDLTYSPDFTINPRTGYLLPQSVWNVVQTNQTTPELLEGRYQIIVPVTRVQDRMTCPTHLVLLLDVTLSDRTESFQVPVIVFPTIKEIAK